MAITPWIDNVFVNPREFPGLKAILLTKLDEVFQGLISQSRSVLLALHRCQEPSNLPVRSSKSVCKCVSRTRLGIHYTGGVMLLVSYVLRFPILLWDGMET
jgi:hypothetical protein